MKVAIDARMISYTGIGRYIKCLIEGLVNIDTVNRYAVLLNGPDRGRLENKGNIEISSPKRPIPVYSAGEHTYLPFEIKGLAADIVHYPSFNMPLISPYPAVVTIHDLIYYIYRSSCPGMLAHIYARLIFNITARGARRVITVSGHSKRDIVNLLGIRPDKVTVIHNGVSGSFRPCRDAGVRDRVMKRYGIDAGYILYVGNHAGHKNIGALVRAFSMLSSRLRSYKLVVAGKVDKRRQRLYSLPEELGIKDRAAFIGAVDEDDLPCLYSWASLFVFPSLYEGFGLPLLEAMACGCPVVASDAASIPEVVGDAAMVVDAKDPCMLSVRMEEALSSKSLQEELRGRGLERAALFTWEAAAKKTLDVYEGVCKS
ncbi:MAG: glycosyltransferase family 4 protein [Deltaproteobacteria bacterium]|nr:glycosyltransferase family 4 protein [Deltaproteobacteria bacterium]